jgi:hypothetical protein
VVVEEVQKKSEGKEDTMMRVMTITNIWMIIKRVKMRTTIKGEMEIKEKKKNEEEDNKREDEE